MTNIMPMHTNSLIVAALTAFVAYGAAEASAAQIENPPVVSATDPVGFN